MIPLQDGAQTGPALTEGRYRFAGALWISAIVLLVLSEAVIVSVQMHRGRGVWSFSFWYAPLMFTTPMSAARHVYKQVAREVKDGSRLNALSQWSYHLASLTCLAMMTTTVCYIDLFAGGF